MPFDSPLRCGLISHVEFSDDKLYRYSLTRAFPHAGLAEDCLFIMLNPSTADETLNDPTVERCQRRAYAMRFSKYTVVNIFALRSTDPKALYHHPDPIGRGNDAAIMKLATKASMVICGWGTHGDYMDRGKDVKAMLDGRAIKCYHLGRTKSGQPRHPLYISNKTEPTLWI
jgi:hypothetical protein